MKITYAEAIRQGFDFLLSNYPEVFITGQGLWSPWYVGNTMKDLEKKFGKDRVIDTPVSEAATTSAALGASLFGKKPIVVHPRLDFMILASDSIVNQAAKWRHMLGGQTNAALTIRGIINRGGEQGAQHSQSLQSWYAHIPGLRVVMPYSVNDARDLLIASCLSPDPVLYIDDRWLYEEIDTIKPIKLKSLSKFSNKIIKKGNDITIASCSWGVKICLDAASLLKKKGINAEVVDLKVLNPFDDKTLIQSVMKTNRLLSVDISWKTCGISSEIIARVSESIDPKMLISSPARITLPDCPAPSSKELEKYYYPNSNDILKKCLEMFQ